MSTAVSYRLDPALLADAPPPLPRPVLLDELVTRTVETLTERVLAEVATRLAEQRLTTGLVDQVIEATGRALAARALELAEHGAEAHVRLGLTVAEAAGVSGIGQGELRRRCAAPASSPLHLRSLRIGRRMVIPRSEIVRLMSEEAR